MAMQSFSPESGQISCSTSQPVISARNLNHFYGEGELRKQVLSNIDLDIYPGEIIIMTGPSGSGKTTLLTLMGGLRSAQEAGRLTILGQDLYNASEVKLAHLRRNIGYIFQAHNLLTSLTARQNVRMSLELHERFLDTDMDALAAEMLTAVEMAAWSTRPPGFPDDSLSVPWAGCRPGLGRACWGWRWPASGGRRPPCWRRWGSAAAWWGCWPPAWLQRETPAPLQGRVMALAMLAGVAFDPLSPGPLRRADRHFPAGAVPDRRGEPAAHRSFRPVQCAGVSGRHGHPPWAGLLCRT